jgi:hypothetical protein
MHSSDTTDVLTYGAAVVRMPRPAVRAVIEVIVVVSFTIPSITGVSPITVLPITVLPITEVSPITVLPICKVVSIVTKVVKIMVEVAEEKERCETHVKR